VFVYPQKLPQKLTAFSFALVLNLLLCLSVQLSAQAPSSSAQPSSEQTLLSQPQSTNADNQEYLFTNTQPKFMLLPSLRVSSAREHLGSMLGVTAGAALTDELFCGLGTVSSFSHPSLGMGYTGLVLEYSHQPHKLIHAGARTLLGYGYAWNGSSSFNFFGIVGNMFNLFRSQFGVIEPEVFAEINLYRSFSATLGVSYRAAFGYNGREAMISNESLSGVSINLSVRLRDL
jgi:hypothetical protein